MFSTNSRGDSFQETPHLEGNGWKCVRLTCPNQALQSCPGQGRIQRLAVSILIRQINENALLACGRPPI